MAYVITDACVDVMDKSCVKECPVDCIYEGERSLYIHPTECIDCGACEATCPVDAIYFDLDLEDDQQDAVRRTAEVFAEVGSPGGARKSGKLGKDHPEIAALPPKED